MSNVKMIALTAVALAVAGLVLGWTSVKSSEGNSCGSPFHHATYTDDTCDAALSSAQRAPIGLLVVSGVLGVGAMVATSSWSFGWASPDKVKRPMV